jgi:hypothetical protein
VASSESAKCIQASDRDLTEQRKSNSIEEGGDQAAAILKFLEESHGKLDPVVPKVHEHYRQGTGPGVSWLPPTHSPILPSS